MMGPSRGDDSKSENSDKTHADQSVTRFKVETITLQITAHKLNGKNYLQWSQSIKIVICGRRKFEYITGEAKALAPTDSTYKKVVGIYVLEAPVLHPMSEGLFNFVIGWTFMFAPLLFTDRRRDRYKGSLDVLWGLQMFLTNTFLIPYMAIRLNKTDSNYTQRKRSQLESVMTKGASVVGLSGGVVCLISVLWALFGRMDGNFGGIVERFEVLISYLGSERLAYAFIWDIGFYIVFQPWLIGDNLQNVEQRKVGMVKFLGFFPVVGLIAYLVCLTHDEL
ncbi:hypothetical protein L484_007851 [Morus notabilis]|uniref:Retrotransposon Copia-like N-terminal domain-containing protein n=1 Tax=Morus notabilis TaxID=981085 RepID=W9RUV6_9ROSA|nr:hypothetical protein L484_007851 [Morus notabilis]